MMEYLLIIPILASFVITAVVMPRWIKKARQIGLVWDDMNKYRSDKVAGSGGLIAVLGFVIAVLLFVAYMTFYLQDSSHLSDILSILIVVLLFSGMGLIDDLMGWKRGGLSIRSRLAMMFLGSIPLIVINAGKHVVSLPLIGQMDLGLFYPLILIPIGVVGATATYNFLAGFNGLEAGQGIIILTSLGLVAFLTGNSWLSVIALCMVAALFAFLLYNFHPARVFPGNSVTVSIGCLIAAISIIGNFEKIAVFFFIPYILETVLKVRGKLIKQSFGKPNKDGSLDLLYDKIYGLEHVAIWFLNKTGIRATEKKVVYTLWIFQLIIIVIGFIIFREGIFQ